ncbi:MAG: hypothetical protein F4W90_02170 [Gammaproteobacteria bacterium]|nr:hypothetical protein [Gammaproteobacteria bacterium]
MSTILDPTDERKPVVRSITARSGQLEGSIALLDIRKPRGNILLDRLAELLAERYPKLEVKRFEKPTFTKPAPTEVRQHIKANADLVVEGLAD